MKSDMLTQRDRNLSKSQWRATDQEEEGEVDWRFRGEEE